MAGSLKWMKYQSDLAGAPDGNGNPTSRVFAAKVDESNGNIMGFAPFASAAELSAAEVISMTAKRNQKVIPRYVLWQGQLPSGKVVSRKLWCGDPSNQYFRNGGQLSLFVSTGGATGETVAGYVTFAQGEGHSFPSLIDTGLDDGTAT